MLDDLPDLFDFAAIRLVTIPFHRSNNFAIRQIQSSLIEVSTSSFKCSFATGDAGPFGSGNAGHSHSDTLSLVVTAGDGELLIDSGAFSYMDPEWLNLFRGSSAHNTIRIDGNDQAIADGPFRWTQKPEVKLLEFASSTSRDYAVAICCYRGFTHTRTVECTDNVFSVDDQIEGPAGEHEIEQFWHFAFQARELSPGKWTVGATEHCWAVVVRSHSTLPQMLHALVASSRDRKG